jgi:hypothetical protein
MVAALVRVLIASLLAVIVASFAQPYGLKVAVALGVVAVVLEIGRHPA